MDVKSAYLYLADEDEIYREVRGPSLEEAGVRKTSSFEDLLFYKKFAVYTT